MVKIFEHTAKERGLWRGWFRDGQSVEISWGRRGWEFGAKLTIHNDDDDRGRRLINIAFWRLSVWLPLGFTSHPWPPLDGPRWGIMASHEFGMCLYWGTHRKAWDWPWQWHTLAYETLLKDGTWRDLDWREKQELAQSETHPYTYTLRSGKVQSRIATVTRRRHVLTYIGTRRLRWPQWEKHSIDVEFDDEVGERSGSWKGGCIGCSYDLRSGETMEQALRRMEAERVFK